MTEQSTELQVYLQSNSQELAAALPAHLNADRMIRLALTLFERDGNLQKCTPQSIMGSLLQASQMGLEIGVNGQGYLIPYFDKNVRADICTFVPGWKGLVDIVNRAGKATVWTGAVFEGDEFDYAIGDSPFIKHKPMGEDHPNCITHVYAVGRITGTQWPVIEVWPIGRVRRHFEKFNKVGGRHYAIKNWEMYARKVPLLQVLKYMPSSIELANALQAAYVADGIPDGDELACDGDVIDQTGEVIGKTQVTPQRKSAAKPAPSPAPTPTDATPKATGTTDSSPIASAGCAKWVENNVARAGLTVEQACQKVGIASLAGLTEAKFKELQNVIRGK